MSQTEADCEYTWALLAAKAGRKEEAEYYLKKAQSHGVISPRRIVIFETALNPKRFRKSNRSDRLEAMGFDLTPIPVKLKVKKETLRDKQKYRVKLRKMYEANRRLNRPTNMEKYLDKYTERMNALHNFKYVEAWWYSARGESLCVCQGKAVSNKGIRLLLARAAKQTLDKGWKYEHEESVFQYRAVSVGMWISLKGVVKNAKRTKSKV